MAFAGIRGYQLVKNLGHSSNAYVYRVKNGHIQPRVDKLVEMIEACGLEIVELKVRRAKPNQESRESGSNRPN